MSCIAKRYIEERSNAPDLFGNYSHDELVCGGREEKGDEHGAGARELIRGDGRCVDVSQKKIVYGFVPLAVEFVPRCRVPL